MELRQPDLAVVVVHFGDEPAAIAQTTELVRCLERDPTLGDVVLVDNGPRRHRWATTSTIIVETGRNRGYGGGANIGIDVAIGHGARDVAVLATDAVVGDSTLAALARAGDQAGAALSGPRIVYEGGHTVWADGIAFDDRWAIARNRNKGRPAASAVPPVGPVPLTGHVLVFHDPADRPWLRFDPTYFMYYEDLDLCERVVAQGEKVHLAPEIIVAHRKPGQHRHRFGPTQQFHMSRSGVLHLRRHPNRRALPLRVAGFAALTLYRCLRADSLRSALAAARGVVDGARVPA